jgi:hypothetical protein
MLTVESEKSLLKTCDVCMVVGPTSSGLSEDPGDFTEHNDCSYKGPHELKTDQRLNQFVFTPETCGREVVLPCSCLPLSVHHC